MLQVCFSQPRAAQVRDEGQGKSNGLLQLTSRGQQAGPNEVQFGEEEGSYADHSAPENSIITQVGQQVCCFYSSGLESLRGQRALECDTAVTKLPAAALQVTTREKPKRPNTVVERKPAPGSPGWRSRLQTLLCCFTPQANDQYYRPEPEAIVIRPPQPPAPPSHIGEPVIGPMDDMVGNLDADLPSNNEQGVRTESCTVMKHL